ncbi:hypothetical protein CTZ27_32215 [Streptomyces griseocarneus]|nr:hypothetical protein CTZ27_32215 [Streptomyces griseocarneus]
MRQRAHRRVPDRRHPAARPQHLHLTGPGTAPAGRCSIGRDCDGRRGGATAARGRHQLRRGVGWYAPAGIRPRRRKAPRAAEERSSETMRMRHRAGTAVAALALAAASAGTALATECEHDENFLTTFHQGGMAEIAAGKDAARHAVLRCTKETGEVLVADHTRLDDQLRALAKRLNVSLPSSTTPEQQQEMKDITKRAGTRGYDTAWLKAQETAHVATLKLMDDEISGGKDREVREDARKARPYIARHLDLVRDCVRKSPGKS